MKQFKHILFVLLISFISVNAIAQNDKVDALRVAFINKKLSLTNAEADKFWPVYNEHNDKVKALRKNLRQSYKKDVDKMNDKELEELYQLTIKTKQAESELYKVYYDKIKAIIGVKKIVLLHLAEDEFKKEMIKNIQDKSD